MISSFDGQLDCLTKLEYLSVSQNNIEKIDGLNLPNLKILMVEENKIHNIDENINKLVGLQELNVSKQCKGTNIATISLPYLKNFICNDNSIGDEDLKNLAPLINIEKIEIMNNKI
mmetsp:Transcript_9635/g.8468  ORF Transcript_9635/g.8468 Transcript_9635/m.8468 type:complete len:116 (+) Transcript_9635:131-478(+)